MKRILGILFALSLAANAQAQDVVQVVTGGNTSQTIRFFIKDATALATTGNGLAGLAFNSAGLTCRYSRQNAGSISITLADAAGSVVGAWASGSFIAVDGTNMPGLYELGLPDAAISNTSSVKYVNILCKGATNMVPVAVTVLMTQFDLNTSTQAVNVTRWNGTNVASPATAGYPAVTIKDGTGTGEIDTNAGAVVAVTTATTCTTASTCSALTTNNDKTGYALSGTQTFNNTGTWTGGFTGSVGSLGATAKSDVQTELATYGALKPTTASRTLDVAATGEAGVDFSNVNGTLDAIEIGTDAITPAKIALDGQLTSESTTTLGLASGGVTVDDQYNKGFQILVYDNSTRVIKARSCITDSTNSGDTVVTAEDISALVTGSGGSADYYVIAPTGACNANVTSLDAAAIAAIAAGVSTASGAQTLTTGTAQSGGNVGTKTFRLAASESANADFKYAFLVITGGAGTQQVRQIVSHDGSTDRVIVDRPWKTQTDSSSTYAVIAFPLIKSQIASKGG